MAIVQIEYGLSLERWIRNLQIHVNDYTNCLRTLVSAIYFAKLGMIHPELISPKRISEIAEKVRKLNPDSEFPVPRGEIRSEELAAISSIRVGHAENRLIFELRIPLLMRTHFTTYKMHPCSVLQKYDERDDQFAYIIPKNPYLTISSDHELYMTTDDMYMTHCKQSRHYQICSPNQPLFRTISQPTCESSLLTAPTQEALSSCDIRLTSTLDPVWIYLNVLKGWLYSTAVSEPLKLICDGNLTETIPLGGAGILQVRPGCSARTTYISLTGIEIIKDAEQYFYTPSVSLEVSNLIPEIRELYRQNHGEPAQHLNPGQSVGTKYKQRETSLNQLVTELNEMETHHRERTVHRPLLYSAIGGTALLTIAITLYLFKIQTMRACAQAIRCCRPKRKYDPESASEQTPSDESATQQTPPPVVPKRTLPAQ
ncbi:uncharacterized protein LOC112495458 [Cephus cinctus]|uniref:Uncharacterized protein LOC112495458 n=1 Tax=Cephus cinctus TaxID=211228 RepID=A0AAJ7RVC7_CEPCN|nr:uncharacterized protein LOC112495458 [Cephus cinctus]